ncbi:MAG TPA: DUF6232 family protein [Micromonosporaceae bacterium]|nr:DUF6232 family protein [Micromonosporaceae bacterium]
MDATRPPAIPPENQILARVQSGHTAPAASVNRPVVLYRQPGICVTTEWILVANRRLPVRELTTLQTARGPHHPLVARAVVVTGLVLAGVGAALSFTGGLARLSTSTYLALGTAAFVPVLIALIGQRLRPRAFELWAQYQGRATLVFSSDDERQYGQVSRALLRAQEMARLGGVTAPVASRDLWRR